MIDLTRSSDKNCRETGTCATTMEISKNIPFFGEDHFLNDGAPQPAINNTIVGILFLLFSILFVGRRTLIGAISLSIGLHFEVAGCT